MRHAKQTYIQMSQLAGVFDDYLAFLIDVLILWTSAKVHFDNLCQVF